MGILLVLLLGGLAGWAASKIMYRDADQGVLGNIIVGILGAFLANLLLAPVFGLTADLGTLSIGSFLLAIGGSVILLAIVNFFTRGRVR